MNKESMLTNFAIWLQAVHGEELSLRYISDKYWNELAREWLVFSGEQEKITLREKQREFPGYNAASETCDYCKNIIFDVNCNTWHCHFCGYYSLHGRSNYCDNCSIPKPILGNA